MSNQVSSDLRADGPSKTHFAYLDGLRGCAALYVVIHHAMMTVPGVDGAPGLVGKLGQLLGYGHVAVDIFIVLSGFCLMLPLLRGNAEIRRVDHKKFFLRRAKRILPPYFFALLFSLALIFLLIPDAPSKNVWSNSVPVRWQDIGLHLLLIHDAFAFSYLKINYVFWSIAVEWRIYFLFPFLVMLWIRYGPIVATSLAIFTGYLLLFLLRFTPVNVATAGVSPHFLGLFALGMLASGIVFAREHEALVKLRDQSGLWLCLNILFAFLVVVATKIPMAHENQTPFCDIFVGLWSSTLLIVIATGKRNWLRELLGAKPISFVGRFAYSLYLVHAPLLEIMWRFFISPLNLSPILSLAILASAGAIIITVVSYLFFLGFERPFLRATPSNPQKNPFLSS